MQVASSSSETASVDHIEPLDGYTQPKPMLFATIYPVGGDSSDFDTLRTAVSKLTLNDSSVTVEPEQVSDV